MDPDLGACLVVLALAVAFCFGRYVYPRQRKAKGFPHRVADIRDTF